MGERDDKENIIQEKKKADRNFSELLQRGGGEHLISAEASRNGTRKKGHLS